MGTGFGHLAIEVNDVYEAVERIKNAAGKAIRPAGSMNASLTIIAFIENQDSYQIELIGKK